MRQRSLAAVTTVLALVLLAPAGLAKPALEVLESPDVVVANPPENMTRENFNPDYVFSATVRVNNDDDARQINLEAIVYPDPSVEDCPRDKAAYPVSFIVKTRKLDAGGTATLGGAAHPQAGSDAEYWPLAVSKEYRNARTGQNQSIEEGEHTFCTNIRVTGEDPACDRPANRTCVIATESFRSYVRRSNAAPEITSFEISNEAPRPNQQVLFQADATDEDTKPREDTLRYTWILGGTERTGKTVRYAFGTAGSHNVTLEVTDGFDTVERTATIQVGQEGTNGPGDGGRDVPSLAPVALVVAVLGAAWLRRRR